MAPAAEPSGSGPTRTPLRVLLVVYAVLMLAGSLHPNPPLPLPGLTARDLLLHLFGYGVLGALVTLSLGDRVLGIPVTSRSARFLVTVAAGTIYGVALELAQELTGRVPEVVDALANLLGVSCGAAVATLVSRRAA